jgi:hypothetical protein
MFDVVSIGDLAESVAGQRQQAGRPTGGRDRPPFRLSVAKTEEDYRRVVAARYQAFAREYDGARKAGSPTIGEWDRRGELLFIEDSGRVTAGMLALAHTHPLSDSDFYYDRFVSGASMAEIFDKDDIVVEMAQLFSVDRSHDLIKVLLDGFQDWVRRLILSQDRRPSSIRCFYGAVTPAHALMYREMLSGACHNFVHIKELEAEIYGLRPMHIAAEFRPELIESLGQQASGVRA